MTEDQRELLVKAHESLTAASLLLRGGYPDFAVSRAYYAMFYIAEAFLEGEGMSFSKHSGVIAAFGKHFAHTGKVSKEFHRFLMEAQEARNVADYGIMSATSLEQAKEVISRAKQFIKVAENLIGSISTSNM